MTRRHRLIGHGKVNHSAKAQGSPSTAVDEAGANLPSASAQRRCPEKMAYSVVVPVYNSAVTLERLYDRLIAVMESLDAPFELVFVDDCSTDQSWLALSQVAHIDGRVIALQLTSNVGQGQATLIGLNQASGEMLITLDDDLQHPPEEIPKLIAALKTCDAFEAVYGIPIRRGDVGWRRASSWIFNFILGLILFKPFRLRTSGFRALRSSLVERLAPLVDRAPIISVLLFQVTPRIGVVRVAHCKSRLGASRYSFGRLVRLSLDTLRCLPEGRRLLAFVIAVCIGTSLLTLAALANVIASFGGFAYVIFAFSALLFVAATAQLSSGERRRHLIPPPAVARAICGRREIKKGDCPTTRHGAT